MINNRMNEIMRKVEEEYNLKEGVLREIGRIKTIKFKDGEVVEIRNNSTNIGHINTLYKRGDIEVDLIKFNIYSLLSSNNGDVIKELNKNVNHPTVCIYKKDEILKDYKSLRLIEYIDDKTIKKTIFNEYIDEEFLDRGDYVISIKDRDYSILDIIDNQLANVLFTIYNLRELGDIVDYNIYKKIERYDLDGEFFEY